MAVAIRRVDTRIALRIALVGLLVVAGWFAFSWFRDSSLVRVKHVSITGISSPDRRAIERDLNRAAHEMTSLHVDVEALQQAVREYPVVRSVSASGDFPSSLKITVHEYRPSAVVDQPGGGRVAVAEDGTLLPHVDRSGLPVIKVSQASLSKRISDTRALALVALLSEAPAELRSKLGRAYWGSQGVRVTLDDGPSIDFGTPAEAAAKWRAAARVLADPTSAGATLIDVRVPNRPAAGGFSPGEEGTASAAPAGSPADTEGDPAEPDPTAVDPVAPSDAAVAPEDPTTP